MVGTTSSHLGQLSPHLTEPDLPTSTLPPATGSP